MIFLSYFSNAIAPHTDKNLFDDEKKKGFSKNTERVIISRLCDHLKNILKVDQ